MALSHEDAQELRDTYANLTAEELRGMRGDNPDEDALIDEILAQGKAVELKDGPAPVVEEEPPAEDPDADPDTDPDADPDADPDDDPDADPDAPQPQDDPQPADAPAPVADAPAPAAEAPPADIPQLDLTPLAAKYDQKLADLDTANARSLKALMDGDKTPEEYAAEQAQYLRDRDQLRDDKTAEAQWHQEVHQHRINALKDGVDYFRNAEHNASWDDWVKRLASKPEHADKSPSWVLQQAHKKVMAEFDIVAPSAKAAAKPAENAPEVKKVAPKTARTPKLDNIPPTLSGLPAAAPAASGDGGEFDHLTSLDGIDFERALARLTPDQQARFLAG